MVCRWTQLFSLAQHYYLALCRVRRVVKIMKKISFSAGEGRTWRVRVRAHFSRFSIPFFILNYPFDTNFGNPAVESSRTIYQGAFLVFFYFSFFYGYSRDRPHSIFFYVTLGQKRSNVKVAREINIPSAWRDYARPWVTYKSRRPR